MTRKHGKSGRPSGRPSPFASLLGHPGASSLPQSASRGSLSQGGHEQTVDIEAAVRQSSSAAAAQFSTARGTFPRLALKAVRGCAPPFHASSLAPLVSVILLLCRSLDRALTVRARGWATACQHNRHNLDRTALQQAVPREPSPARMSCTGQSEAWVRRGHPKAQR